jgi:hypothetical protein
MILRGIYLYTYQGYQDSCLGTEEGTFSDPLSLT